MDGPLKSGKVCLPLRETCKTELSKTVTDKLKEISFGHSIFQQP